MAEGQIFRHLLFAQKPFSSPPTNVAPELCCSRFSKAEINSINAQKIPCLLRLGVLRRLENLKKFYCQDVSAEWLN